MASAAPSAVESTAQPATNPAIESAKAQQTGKKLKDKKGEAAASSPLEVCLFCIEKVL